MAHFMNVLQFEIHANFHEIASETINGVTFCVNHPFGPISSRKRTYFVDHVETDRDHFVARLYERVTEFAGYSRAS